MHDGDDETDPSNYRFLFRYPQAPSSMRVKKKTKTQKKNKQAKKQDKTN